MLSVCLFVCLSRFISLALSRGAPRTLLRFQRRLPRRIALKEHDVPTLERCRNVARSWRDRRPRVYSNDHVCYCPVQFYCTLDLSVLLLYTKATRKHTPSLAISWWIALETRCGRRSTVVDSTYVITDSRTSPRGCIWRRVTQRLPSWKQGKKTLLFFLRVGFSRRVWRRLSEALVRGIKKKCGWFLHSKLRPTAGIGAASFAPQPLLIVAANKAREARDKESSNSAIACMQGHPRHQGQQGWATAGHAKPVYKTPIFER